MTDKFPAPLDAPVWNPETDEVLHCRAVIQETHDVRTFVFTAPEPRRFLFRPGQFLTFVLPVGGEDINRCYTVSSSPSRPYSVAITVKRVPGGVISNWLHDTMREGMDVRALGPMGDFSCDLSPARKFLFLSAGSGITPMMSMSRFLLDTQSGRDIAFVHSARSPADLIFRTELAAMEQASGLFRTTYVCEGDAPFEKWPGHKGRLNIAVLGQATPDFMEREVYVCGPAPYMQAVKAMLADAGFDMRRYHEESFDFGTLLEQEPEVAEVTQELEDAAYTISFTKSRREIACPSGTPVLAAARAAGMRLPASCAKGMCGTCKCKLVSGEVDMQHQGGIRQREIDQGFILLCCSRPLSDLVVER
ncbi:hybrid-cluster NAD(P)-dependent oxidoreductase [Acetobacter sp. TBRC 12305]|uniref:Hybrid-cluster NAD(P)-dependent oxidoreductase n=1 Tax=Acetobacter garciniae TaxID=2817435 RepID=A0A939HK94_9PROT|nr:hybrid-cluster NAD(P)-dependent oxidoreductase [Acetobacter garciniae]MBO1325007.1 hybrid-cluster NAD(P)-dependent oxidoreductase [Acetobacter garciniae]MBX0344698.1 hybrid-cluster NAD(P)-dependent oxidoreductase [Acetobacter garciniae]